LRKDEERAAGGDVLENALHLALATAETQLGAEQAPEARFVSPFHRGHVGYGYQIVYRPGRG
jgi:hypothetical protein